MSDREADPSGSASDGDGPVSDSSADSFDPVAVFPDAADRDLRTGADDCYKCSTCDSACPVAAVDEEFPGPKFQGPEQWRLRRREDADVDPSVTKCSNCMRCDGACPTDVPLSQLHNTARAAYVEEGMSRFSRKYVRNRLLANYERAARVASRVPRLSTALANNRAVRWLGERLLGITAEREFPEFATETFREWYRERGGLEASRRRARAARQRQDGPAADDADATAAGDDSDDVVREVAYFHGCYANYNTPEVARALVRVYEDFGYAVRVPEQRCSGTPMFANGMLDDAERAATVNGRELGAAVEDGCPVITTCTSCSLALSRENPELFDADGVEAVADDTWDAIEYLRVHEDLEGALSGADVDLDAAYHAPCHARVQGLEGQALAVLDGVDGVDARDVGDSCSGISGTYGWKREHYGTSMAIGREMFEHIEATDAEVGLTECPTCAMQMRHGTGQSVVHPVQVIAAALDPDAGGRIDG